MRIKIVDLNIWLGGILLDSAIEFIKNEAPDILILQEVHQSPDETQPRNFRTISEIRMSLGYKHYFFDPAFIKVLDGNKAEAGNAIFSHFPIISKESYSLGGEWGEYDERDGNFEELPRKLQHAVIKTENIELNVFNTQGIWGKDGSDNPERLRMGKVISETVQGKENVILAGDFNVQPDTKTIKMIEDGLNNVFKDELRSTFNTKHKKNPGFATAVVDMLFVSPNLAVTKHYCPDIDVSDHLPLVAVLEV